MAGLVADYGSDSESDSSDCSGNITESATDTPLPKPKFDLSEDGTIKEKSVFVNPFAEADKAEKAILEKHVKMISVDVKMVNGKKICWNYRKNKCRFGHNCKYAHDSDLQIDKSLITPAEMRVKQIDIKKLSVDPAQEATVKKKKRPGMALNLVPSKKVMKLYSKQKKLDSNTKNN